MAILQRLACLGILDRADVEIVQVEHHLAQAAGQGLDVQDSLASQGLGRGVDVQVQVNVAEYESGVRCVVRLDTRLCEPGSIEEEAAEGRFQ